MQEQERGLQSVNHRFTPRLLLAGCGDILQQPVDVGRVVALIAHQARREGDEAGGGVAGLNVEAVIAHLPVGQQGLEKLLVFGRVREQIGQGGLRAFGGRQVREQRTSGRVDLHEDAAARGPRTEDADRRGLRRDGQPILAHGGRLPGNVFGQQDKTGLSGEQDRVDRQDTFQQAAVAPRQTAFERLAQSGCSPLLSLEPFPDGRVVRFARQQVGQLQKLQLAGRVAQHAQEGGVGVAAAIIQDQQGAFGGGLDQGVVTLGGFVQVVDHFLAFPFDLQALLEDVQEQQDDRAGN